MDWTLETVERAVDRSHDLVRLGLVARTPRAQKIYRIERTSWQDRVVNVNNRGAAAMKFIIARLGTVLLIGGVVLRTLFAVTIG